MLFWIRNIADEKAIIYKKFLSRKRTSDFVDSEKRNEIKEKRAKNTNILDKCFAIEDIEEKDDSYEFDTIYNINPSYMSKCFDIININSNNTSNDYKAFDECEFRNPFIKQETATNLPKTKKILEIYKMNKRIGRIKKIPVI